MIALRSLALFCLALLVLSGASVAQGSGDIDGQVAREAGGGIRGVIVEVVGLGVATETDASGNFSFSDVPAGTYQLSFTRGNEVASLEDVKVDAGATTRADLAVDWDLSFVETITVFSASRRAERIVDAPAAVTVVTEEEIERQASHGQVPKLLEFTPGAEVTQSGIYDYNFNTRGFNSSLNRRVATLIDGRDPSVPFLGAQEWAAIGFPLDDLANLELVRGPSAALYGANASSGVLNMTTKAPGDSQGGALRLTGGELSTANVDFRWATGLGADWYLKLLGGLRDSGDFTVSRNGQAEYSVPCTRPGQTDCLPQEAVPLAIEDDNQIVFGGVRLDKSFDNGSLLAIEGGQTNIEGPAFQTGIGRVQLVDIERPWARVNYSTQNFNLLGYFNQRKAPEQLALSSGNNLALETENYQLEAQTNWDFADGDVRLVLGASYGEEEIDSFDPRTGRQSLVFRPISSDQTAAFGQIDWSLTDRVKLVVAGRWDDSSLHDSQFSPKGSLVWGINNDHTLRLTYNEAFQVANYSEFFLQAQVGAFPGAPLNGACVAVIGVSCGLPGLIPVLALGNEDLELEEVKTVELGYSGIIGGRAFLTVDYYNSQNENFITDLIPQTGTALGRVNPNFGLLAGVPASFAAFLDGVVGGFVPGAVLTNNVDGSPIIAAVSYTNFGEVDTQGIDLGLNYYVGDNTTLSFNYSWFDFDIKEDLPGFDSLLLPNSPENKISAAYSYKARKWDASVSARWVDDFRWGVGPFQGDVDSYTTVDLTGNYEINDFIAIGLNVANLFDDEHWESFGGDLLGRRALAHIAFDW